MVLPYIEGNGDLEKRFWAGDATLSEDLKEKLKKLRNGHDMESIIERFNGFLKNIRESVKISISHSMYYYAACQLWNSSIKPGRIVYH